MRNPFFLACVIIWAFIVVTLLSSCAVPETVRVLKVDGKVVSCSGYSEWPKCLNEACPNGFEVLDDKHDIELIRCK